jgi:hypothetical protein
VLIPNSQLCQWVAESSVRANARNSEHIRQIIDTFEHTGLVADSNSEESRCIQNIAKVHREIIISPAFSELERTEIFGVAVPQCDAFPMYYKETPCIIVFDGLLQLVRFNTDLQILIALLNEKIPEETIEVNGEHMSIALAMSLAGHVALTESIDTGHQLMDITAVLGSNATQRSEYGYGAAVIFYVLHELGHIVCGHLEQGFVSERMSIDIAISEDINENQKMEFEADSYALSCIHPNVRNPIISSLVFALGPFAFLETFRGNLNKKHPLTVNRIAELARQVDFPEEPELAEAVLSVVTSEVNRFERLAEERRLNNGNIQKRIRNTMTLSMAYETMNKVGNHIKENFGTLDF